MLRVARPEGTRALRITCYILLCFALAACGRSEQNPTSANTPLSVATSATSNSSVALAAALERITALGVIRPRQTLALSFRTPGVIRTIVTQIGTAVRKGERLAEIDTAELALTLQNAQADVTIEQAQLDLIQSNPQRSQPERVIAEAQLQQAQIVLDQLTLQMDGATIDAPFDGIVSAIHAHPGEFANAGQAVVEVIDTQRWLVETNNVSELNISRIVIGQAVSVRVIVLPDQPLRGKVITIDPVAIVQQGDTTYTLYIELAQSDLPLLTGMNVEVEIEVNRN